MDFGVCPDCKKPNTGYAWCKKCDPGKFLKEGKTSGISEIDNLIYDSQLRIKHFGENHLEWIPYDRFQDIKQIAKGGYGTIYYAIWVDGYINGWDIENQQWKRYGYFEVVLKKFNNIVDINEDFLNEVK